MSRWRRVATALLVVLVVASSVYVAVGQRNLQAARCQDTVANYDSITRILNTGDTSPLDLSGIDLSEADPGTLHVISQILAKVNVRTDRQNADIDKVRGPRPSCS